MIGGADEGGNIEPIEMPVGEGGQKIAERARPVPVALAIDRGFDLGHPVDQLQSIRAGMADRINHHLAVRQPSGPYHAGAR